MWWFCLHAEVTTLYVYEVHSSSSFFLYSSPHTELFSSGVSPFSFIFIFFILSYFGVLRLYFNFLEIIWLDTKKKKKTSGRDFCFPYSSSLLAQNILIGCRTFVSQIPTTPPLTPSEPRISPSRKFFVLLMRSCSCWAQLCQSHQHPRQACTLYAVCVCEGDGIAGLCRKNCGKLHSLISVTC